MPAKMKDYNGKYYLKLTSQPSVKQDFLEIVDVCILWNSKCAQAMWHKYYIYKRIWKRHRSSDGCVLALAWSVFLTSSGLFCKEVTLWRMGGQGDYSDPWPSKGVKPSRTQKAQIRDLGTFTGCSNQLR